MKTLIDMATEAGFDVELSAFKEGTAIALKLIEIAQREEREAAMAAILETMTPETELILRRAWDRVRTMRSNEQN